MNDNRAVQFFGHSYDEITGAYLLPVRVFPEQDGTCPLPDNTVAFAPTEPVGEYQSWRINTQHTAWEVVPDYRSAALWDKASGKACPNRLVVGDLPPSELTVITPLVVDVGTPARSRWSEQLQGWELVPDYSQTVIWDKHTALPLPMLAAGVPLPATAIDVAPPLDGPGPWRYSDTLGLWEIVPAAEILPVPPAPDAGQG